MSRTLALLLPLFVCACGSTSGEKNANANGNAGGNANGGLIVRPGDVPKGSIIRTSRPSPFESMCRELAMGDVVYLGEYHTLQVHHEMQLQVIRQLHARGRLYAIGMEMFQRPFQKHLDDFVAQRIDEATMLLRTEWKKRWRYPYKLYKPILDFAREHRIEVVALNVSSEIKKVISEKGRDGLTAEQLASLPEEDRSFKGYEERAVRIALMHKTVRDKSGSDKSGSDKGGSDKTVSDEEKERYHRGQLLWDDVMADSIVRWIRRSPKNAQMAVVIGGGHVTDSWGVPARVHKRQGGLQKTLVMTMPRMMKDEDSAQKHADFIWIAEGVKLGAVHTAPAKKPAVQPAD